MRPALIVLATLCAAASVNVAAKVSADAAAEIARKLTGGRVIAVDRANDGDRELWRVKVVTSGGQVRVIYIDIETGKPV